MKIRDAHHSRVKRNRMVIISRRQLAVGAIVTATIGTARAARAEQLFGRIGYSTQWGSSWMDLGEEMGFHAGDVLRIVLQTDDAKRVLVRLLPFGASPDDPVGILGVYDVKNKVVEIPIGNNISHIKQISVHGGEIAWGQTILKGNGAAIISSIEVKSSGK